MDLVIYAAIVVSFAVFVTTHIALSYGLTVRAPRWRGLVGLLVAPLAPYWGYRAGLRVRSVLWVLSLLAYATTLLVGFRIGAS